MTHPPIQQSEWWALVDHYNVPWYIETSEDECRRRMAHWGTDAEKAGWSIRRVLVTEAPEVDR